MRYSIILKPIAAKQLKKLDKTIATAIVVALENFASGQICDSRKLKGFLNRYRIPVRDDRAIFDVVVQDNVIYVLRIAHRQTAYKAIEKV